jgi:ribonuclease-3
VGGLGLAHGDPLVAAVQRGAVSGRRRRRGARERRRGPGPHRGRDRVDGGLRRQAAAPLRPPELLAEALTHRSAADPRKLLLDSNERLEFLGDRVLALVMAEWLAERFPQEREGSLGKRLGVLVSAGSAGARAEAMGLGEALRVPPGEKRAGVGGRASVLADALEATLGALYLDGGLDPARALVRREFAPLLEASDRPPVSPKTRLQEWTLGRRSACRNTCSSPPPGPPTPPSSRCGSWRQGRRRTGWARTSGRRNRRPRPRCSRSWAWHERRGDAEAPDEVRPGCRGRRAECGQVHAGELRWPAPR